jgi:phage terminase Nu1 subunit (DNA packaging protein)
MTKISKAYKEPEFEGEVANTAAMCELLALPQTELSKTFREGHVVREGWGAYNWRRSVPLYIQHLRSELADKRAKEGRETIRANVSLKSAQERLTQIKADQLAGQLISLEEIEAAFDALMVSIRQAVLAIPGRVRFGLPHLTAHDQKVIADECASVLEETASGKAPIPRG